MLQVGGAGSEVHMSGNLDKKVGDFHLTVPKKCPLIGFLRKQFRLKSTLESHYSPYVVKSQAGPGAIHMLCIPKCFCAHLDMSTWLCTIIHTIHKLPMIHKA